MTSTRHISVVGLGPMGRRLAHTLRSGGARTTVWNRTRARAAELDGVTVAANPTIAVEAADLVLTVLRDHTATRDVLGSVPRTAYSGRTVVVYASSTPEEARATHEWATARGINLLVGAIMVPTPLIGTQDAVVVYAGDENLLDLHRPALETIAPRSLFVGDDPGRAALLDTAMLEVFFAGMTAFLHASAMVTAQGMRAVDFVPWAGAMLDILPDTFAGLARDVDAGTHPGDEDNLAMELASLAHVLQAAQESGTDTRFPELMHDVAREAVDRGHGEESWSRVIDVLRSQTLGCAHVTGDVAPDPAAQRPAVRRS